MKSCTGEGRDKHFMILSENRLPLEHVLLSEVRQSPCCRGTDKRVVNIVKSKYGSNQIGIPTVNKRDRFYYVIDGNHRIDAMKAAGAKRCMCYVAQVPYEREAEMYFQHHNRKSK